MKYFKVLGLLLFLVTFNLQASVKIHNSTEKGISFTIDNRNTTNIEKIEVGNNKLTRINIEDVSIVSNYGENEYYEKKYMISVPEGATPKINYNILQTETFRTSDLVPSQKLIITDDGMDYYKYVPTETENKNLPIVEFKPASINFEGYNVYYLTFRPLTFDSQQAKLVNAINFDIRYGKNFSRTEKITRSTGSLNKLILNAEFKADNTKSNLKTKTETFLDLKTKWMKLKISETGIYKVTGQDFIDNGIDINSVLTKKVKLFSSAGKDLNEGLAGGIYHGAEEAARHIVDVNGNDFFDSEDYVIFFAAGTNDWDREDGSLYNNKYSDYTYYWLCAEPSAEDGIDMENADHTGAPLSGDVEEFKKFYGYANRNQRLYEGYRAEWKMASLLSSESAIFNFPVSNITSDSVEINFVNNNNSPTIKARYTLNNITQSNIVKMFGEPVNFHKSLFNEGENQIKVFSLSTNGTGEEELEQLIVSYTGRISASNFDEYFKYSYTDNGYYRLKFDGSQNKDFFIVTDPLNPKYANTTDGTVTISYNGDKNKSDYYYVPKAYKSPFEIKTIDMTSKQTLHSLNVNCDMVIITPEIFHDYLNSDEDGLIRAHEVHDGLTTKVVNIEDIINEFGRGYQEPATIRNFLKYTYENWNAEYVLLAGDGNHDYRNVFNSGNNNYIIPSNTESNTYRGSDSYYVAFDTIDKFTQNMAIGRFTVQNLTELKNIVKKTVKFIENPDFGSWKSKLLFAADDKHTSDGYHNWYEGMSHYINARNVYNRIPDSYFVDKLYLFEYPFVYNSSVDLYTKPKAEEELIRRLNQGVSFFVYFGHGKPTKLAHESLLIASSLDNLNNSRPFAMFGGTCSFGVFDDPNSRGLAEQMLIMENRGSIGLINSTRSCGADPNENLGQYLFEYLFEDENNKISLGKAFQYAKTEDATNNSAGFILFGDPALRIYRDYVAVDADVSSELYTLQLDSLKSTIQGGEGLPSELDNFNGTLNVNIYDAEREVDYFNTGYWTQSNDTVHYQLPGNLIYSAPSTINNSESSTKFILPKDLNYGSNNSKIKFYGYNENGIEVTGHKDSLTIAASTTTTPDTTPPDIKIMFNSLDYQPGDPIGQNPIIFVELYDEHGINTSGSIGHKIYMEIDGSVIELNNYFNYYKDSYQKGYAEYQLLNLSEGNHTINIKAWDTYNNYGEETVTFEVKDIGSGGSSSIGNLMNYPNPIKDSGTHFSFTIPNDAFIGDVKITVYTINGRKVQEIKADGEQGSYFQSIYWNGKDADGDEIANGVYLYVAKVELNGKKITKKGKLMFAR